MGGRAYGVIDDILASSVIVDIHGNSSESGYFGRELRETAVVLPGVGKRG